MNTFRFNHKYFNDLPYTDPGRKIRKDIGFFEFNQKILDVAFDALTEYNQGYIDSTLIGNAIKFCNIAHSNLKEFLKVRVTVQMLTNENNLGILDHLIEFISNLAAIADAIHYAIADDSHLQLADWAEDSSITIVNQPNQLQYAGEPLTEYLSDTLALQELQSGFQIEIRYCSDMQSEEPIVEIKPRKMTIDISNALIYIKKFEYLIPSEHDIIEYREIDYFSELHNRNMIIHVPFQSYQMVVNFIDQMCTSENITAIYMSLYRVAQQSKIIESLIKAAKSGKQLYLYIEVLARGNEVSNANLIYQLINYPNVFVNWSYFRFKVHGKMFAAVSTNGEIYWHTGTGNYNEDTAKYYTDIHYIGRSAKVKCHQPSRGKQIIERLESILFERRTSDINTMKSPRYQIRDMIYRATTTKQEIRIKCNNINDPEIINALHLAADAGCSIKIIARTIIGITPHKNISIMTIIGNYLEHERIYIFGNTVNGDEPIAIIGSADLLYRNLSKRIEFLTEVDRQDVETIEDIFNDNWNLGSENNDEDEESI